MVSSFPRVSFCVPTLNSERTLEQCLKSIKMQDYPEFEIIVVDGYSTDRTLDIAQKYTNNTLFCGGTLGAARQLGVEKSAGEILALFDDDVIIPHQNWLAKAVAGFDDSERISTVWPLVISPPHASLFARCYSNFSNEVKLDRLRSGRGHVGGTIALFRKKCIKEVGGFDRRLPWGEDFDIAKKLEKGNYKVVFHNDPLFHSTMRGPNEFLRKQIIGSRTFVPNKFSLTNLTIKQLLYEHLVIGVKGMLCGIFKEIDSSWSFYPLLLAIRLTVYSTVQMGHVFSRKNHYTS
jgi:glycosyltransferase involved in cell wall biosynthesis